ncbi:MAG: cell wall metabolism sensor histidine kinase WalK [Myxococcales bacterium]|nr:cell wall metabolism sensor histidine kinase WalK [Myxococcales bacterium]
MGLRLNLVGTVVAATAALVLTLALIEDPIAQHRAGVELRANLSTALERLEAELRRGGDLDALADRVGAEEGCRLRILDASGRVIADAAYDRGSIGNDPPSAALLERAPRGEGRVADVPGEHGAEIVFFRLQGEPSRMVGMMRSGGRLLIADRSMASVQATRESMRQLVLVGGFVALLSGLILVLALGRTIAAPIRELEQTADALASGDLGARTRSQRSDELGTVGRSLDRMAEQLSARMEDLRAEEARLRAVLDGMVEAVLVTDASARIVVGNAALDRLVGHDFMGRSTMEVIRSPELHEAVRAARRGRSAEVFFEAIVADGARSFVAQVAALPERGGVVAVLHDVTSLQRAAQIRRDFVANASHELRTPLTAIRGFSETLRDGALGDPPTAARFIETILKHTLRLERIVEDLLTLSKAESPEGVLELEGVELEPLVEEVVMGLEPQAKEKQIRLEVRGLDAIPPLLASEPALEEVLRNLVDNGIKYSPAGGVVRVEAALEERSGVRRARISVRDEGPGIAAAHQERIFERFYRIDASRSRALGGTGLGLAIVRHLCAQMGAQVEVESQVHRGTIFHLRVGLAEEAEAERS